MRLSECLARFLEQCAANGRSPHTCAQHERSVRWMISVIGDREVDDVTPADVAQFLVSDAARKTRFGFPKSAATVNALRTSIRCFFRHAHDAGYACTNAGRLVRRARCSPAPPRGLTDEDAHVLTSLGEEIVAVERVMNSARRALAAAPSAEVANPIEHARDFSWIVVRGHRYTFPRPQQAHVMQLLYAEWEKSGRRDGSGLRESTIGRELETATDSFRIVKLFDKHEALGRILRRPMKGIWALFMNEEGPDAG